MIAMKRQTHVIARLLLLCTGLVLGIAPSWHPVVAHSPTPAPTTVSVCQAHDHEHDCTICHLGTVVTQAVTPIPSPPVWTGEEKPLWMDWCDYLPRTAPLPIQCRAPPVP